MSLERRETSRTGPPPVGEVHSRFVQGSWPDDDGWRWLYRAFDRVAPRTGLLRRLVCRYFWPKRLERSADGRLYRLLGVAWFGRVIPTGGAAVRRLTRQKLAAYTLRGTSLGAARDFYYRACVFEGLHLPFLVALAVLTGRQLALGRVDLALQDTLVNLLFNVYPIMHHRRTRARIVGLLETAGRRGTRSGATSAGRGRIHP